MDYNMDVVILFILTFFTFIIITFLIAFYNSFSNVSELVAII